MFGNKMSIFSHRRFSSSNVRKKNVDTEIEADILSKTKSLFCKVLSPELVGKYFTSSTNSDKDTR